MLCLANAPRIFFPNHYSNGLNTSHSNGGVNQNSTLTNNKSTQNKVLLMKSAGVLLETGTAYPSRAHGLTPGFLLVNGAHAFSLICFFTVCLHSVSCPQIAHVSLVCPFLILPPVFSNVYSGILIGVLSSQMS